MFDIEGLCEETCVLDAASSSRIFVVQSGGTLLLRDLRLLNGNGGDSTTAYGGLLQIEGGRLEAYGVTMQDSEAWCGGAMYVCCSGAVILDSCDVSNNRATSSFYTNSVAGGGAFLVKDGGTSMTLMDCSVSDNRPYYLSGSGSQGGAIFMGWNAVVIFSGGSVVNNLAAYGGVAKNDWSGFLHFQDGCLVQGNHAGAGGIVYSWGSSTYFIGATLINNYISSSTVSTITGSENPPNSDHNLYVMDTTMDGSQWSSYDSSINLVN
eukprot:gene7380-8792_t